MKGDIAQKKKSVGELPGKKEVNRTKERDPSSLAIRRRSSPRFLGISRGKLNRWPLYLSLSPLSSGGQQGSFVR